MTRAGRSRNGPFQDIQGETGPRGAGCRGRRQRLEPWHRTGTGSLGKAAARSIKPLCAPLRSDCPPARPGAAAARKPGGERRALAQNPVPALRQAADPRLVLLGGVSVPAAGLGGRSFRAPPAAPAPGKARLQKCRTRRAGACFTASPPPFRARRRATLRAAAFSSLGKAALGVAGPSSLLPKDSDNY